MSDTIEHAAATPPPRQRLPRLMLGGRQLPPEPASPEFDPAFRVESTRLPFASRSEPMRHLVDLRDSLRDARDELDEAIQRVLARQQHLDDAEDRELGLPRTVTTADLRNGDRIRATQGETVVVGEYDWSFGAPVYVMHVDRRRGGNTPCTRLNDPEAWHIELLGRAPTTRDTLLRRLL